MLMHGKGCPCALAFLAFIRGCCLVDTTSQVSNEVFPGTRIVRIVFFSSGHLATDKKVGRKNNKPGSGQQARKKPVPISSQLFKLETRDTRLRQLGGTMAVFLSNVSDYIEPSMNCVNPLKIGEGSDSGSVQNSGTTSDDKVKKTQQKVSLSYEGQAAPKPVVASITLSDCLACSGCITSTESVLVDAQSTSSLEDAVGRGDRVCFMLSALSVVELQRHWEMVAGKGLGRRAVSAFVRERLREFSEGRCVILSSDNSSVRRIWADASYDEFLARFDGGSGPVLAGHCPGLVCYAEKSAHDLVDTLSAIRSPTMISAKLARGAFGEGRAFLTAVEPCYDKKLEVTRSDYRDEAAKVRGGEGAL